MQPSQRPTGLSVFFYPANQVFFEENSLAAYLVRRQSLFYEVIKRLMTDPEEFLSFLKGIENTFHIAGSGLPSGHTTSF